MKCIWQMDGDKVKGFKCEFSPVDMLTIVSGLKYIIADMERHPKDRERATMIYNKIMLARYTDEQDKTGYCNECKWYGDKQVCGRCRSRNLYAPKDKPKQTERIETYSCQVDCKHWSDKANKCLLAKCDFQLKQTDCARE